MVYFEYDDRFILTWRIHNNTPIRRLRIRRNHWTGKVICRKIQKCRALDHCGIVLGEEQFTPTLYVCSYNTAGLQIDTFERFCNGQPYTFASVSTRVENILFRLKQQMSKYMRRKYNLLYNNCQSFVADIVFWDQYYTLSISVLFFMIIILILMLIK